MLLSILLWRIAPGKGEPLSPEMERLFFAPMDCSATQVLLSSRPDVNLEITAHGTVTSIITLHHFLQPDLGSLPDSELMPR